MSEYVQFVAVMAKFDRDSDGLFLVLLYVPDPPSRRDREWQAA